MKIMILFLSICLFLENLIMWKVLKSSEELVETSVELEEKRQRCFEETMEMYNLCMESNRAVDKHCELVQSQYRDVMKVYNSIKNQEENQNGLAV